jgi:hypothetical protein
MGRADTLILGVDAAEAAWALDDDRFGSRIDGHGVAQGRLMSRILFTTALSIMTCPIGVISRSLARKWKFCDALDAAQFTFNSSEDTGFEVTNALKYCMGRVVDMIGQEISQPNGLSNSAHSDTYATIVNRTKVKLAEKRDSLIDDYFNGMMGNQRMKKDPTINIVQNNSPGAVQQIGSNFNQSAYNQSHQSLVQVIDQALASPEFAALGAEPTGAVRHDREANFHGTWRQRILHRV